MLSSDELERFRPRLIGHCYRMLGSVFDADDAVQDTLVRAWRHAEKLEGHAALRAWLYRIATNVCLDFIAERKRRGLPVDESAAGRAGDELRARPREEWVDPIPDAAMLPIDADPEERALLRESTRLAFVAALQRLPAKQRAALLLTEVVGCSAVEAAECLEMTLPGLNSALQRARANLAPRDREHAAVPLTEAQRSLLERYVAAFEAFDIDQLTALLHEDAQLSMPPYTLWLSGPAEIARWLRGLGRHCEGSRLLPIEACGSPAFAQYHVRPEGGYVAWAILVLELAGDRIARWTAFLDVESLFPRFGLPLALE